MRLWTTIVGSHMWGMEHEGSDLDVMEVYIADSKEFLKGNHQKYRGGKHSKILDASRVGNPEIDLVRYEIGFFIEKLISGNCNIIWGLLSPFPVKDLENNFDYVSLLPIELINLRRIFKENLSKACYHSIRGLAINNSKKYLTKDKYSTKWHKKVQMIYRTLQFGINLIKYEKMIFNKSKSYNIERLDHLLDKLDEAYINSDLPAKTDEKPFLDFLLKLRLRDLKDEFI